jgi:hypothetical protein
MEGMREMITLYEQNPQQWNRLSKSGKPSLAAMAKRFHRFHEMDKALGMQNTVRKYAFGGNASTRTEQLAKSWLAANPEQKLTLNPSTDAVLMVIPPAAKLDAVRRVLSALGCEVVDL